MSAAATLAAALATATPAAALSNLKWTGGSSSTGWSHSTNWSGSGPVAAGSYGTLYLRDLGKACDRGSSQATCYASRNDVAGLSVNAIRLNDGLPYELTGDGITIGAGGIDASNPSQNGGLSGISGGLLGSSGVVTIGSTLSSGPLGLNLPITLGADQTWVVDSGGEFGSLNVGPVTGAHQLTVILGDSNMSFSRPVNTSALNLTGGGGQVDAAASLNGTSDGPVTLSNTNLAFLKAGLKSGPISAAFNSSLQVGSGVAPDATLAVDGDVTLDPTSSLQLYLDTPGKSATPAAGTDYSQLAASGSVDLTGAALQLSQGLTKHGCVDLRAGQVYTLVSAASISGNFTAIPNGHTLRLEFQCGASADAARADATAVIHYTATAVTATIKRGGHAGDLPIAKSLIKIRGELVVGHTLSAKGSWSGKPTSFEYRWLVCRESSCSTLRDHTAKLLLKPAMAHRYIAAFVTASNAWGSNVGYGFRRQKVKPAPSKH